MVWFISVEIHPEGRRRSGFRLWQIGAGNFVGDATKFRSHWITQEMAILSYLFLWPLTWTGTIKTRRRREKKYGFVVRISKNYIPRNACSKLRLSLDFLWWFRFLRSGAPAPELACYGKHRINCGRPNKPKPFLAITIHIVNVFDELYFFRNIQFGWRNELCP